MPIKLYEPLKIKNSNSFGEGLEIGSKLKKLKDSKKNPSNPEPTTVRGVESGAYDGIEYDDGGY